MDSPNDFSAKQDGDFVLQLNKSLYGLCQAPLSWYEHLKTNLEQLDLLQAKWIPVYSPITTSKFSVWFMWMLLFG